MRESQNQGVLVFLRNWVVPKFGGRIVKTGIAITLSVLTAHALHLMAPQFAGIVSVLAVQPSVYRSLRNGLQQIISALIGALAGVVTLYLFHESALGIGLVSLLLMGWHAKWRWTNSLLIAVVIAINTMGANDVPYLVAGLNQLALVAIGLGYGNLINLLIKPSHSTRTETKLRSAEKEVRHLFRTVRKDLQRRAVTPYSLFKQTIGRARAEIDSGRGIAQYMWEDQRYSKGSPASTVVEFNELETMVERIRDMSKTMQNMSYSEDFATVVRLAHVTERVQRRMVRGQGCHFILVDQAYSQIESSFETSTSALRRSFINRSLQYHFFLYMHEYYDHLKQLHHIRTHKETIPYVMSNLWPKRETRAGGI